MIFIPVMHKVESIALWYINNLLVHKNPIRWSYSLPLAGGKNTL